MVIWHFFKLVTNCCISAIQSYVHFLHFTGEPKNKITTYVVHTTFLVNHENSCAHMTLCFFNFVKVIRSFRAYFLMKKCRKVCKKPKKMVPEITAEIPRKLRVTYDFLGKPEKFVCTYDNSISQKLLIFF